MVGLLRDQVDIDWNCNDIMQANLLLQLLYNHSGYKQVFLMKIEDISQLYHDLLSSSQRRLICFFCA